MTRKPVLLLYCQHSLGMGHLVRSFSLARALCSNFHVVFLNGGPVPAGLATPRGVEIVNLPPLGMGSDYQLVSRDQDHGVSQAKVLRRQQILAALETFDPSVILIELFPFGRKKFANELLPLLKRARRKGPARPLILCSLREILVRSRRDQQHHDDRARWIADRYFDGILVHSDPKFAPLEESFRPRQPLCVPVYYTGFVLPARKAGAPAQRDRRILVSAGGGIVGASLFRAAIAAHGIVWRQAQIPMTIVAGPFLPETDWRELTGAVENQPGIELHRSVPDMCVLMQGVVASVSQCGYNTAMDILYSRVPALVVPFAEGREDEQMNRARKLERLGALRVLESNRLSGSSLADALMNLPSFEPTSAELDLDGAANTAGLISELASETCRSVESRRSESGARE